MIKRNIVKDEDIIERAQRAYSSGMFELFDRREEVLIRNALYKYDSGDMKHDELVGFIASLSEVRALRRMLDNDVQKGLIAGEQLTGG